MKKSEKDVEIIRGDGLSLSMDTNNKILEILGDGCKISLFKNFGMIRVKGDGCHLKVVQNVGSIEYKGDGGRVHLGAESNNKVTFFGCGGHLKFLGEEATKSRGNRGKVIVENNAKDDFTANLNENQSQKKNYQFERENRENERRERRRKVGEKYQGGANVIGTKIIGSNGECKTNVNIFYKNVDATRS